MTTRMLINATVAHELRIAIAEDGELVELDIEAADQSSIRGNIYKGVVHNVEGSLAAAFIDFGAHKQGFLPFDEVSASQYYRAWTAHEPPRVTDVLRRGQEIIVQATKDAIGEKGAALTTYLSIPGRYTVLMPGSDASGVSRKIEDEVMRKKIRAIASKIVRPEGCGFIVRTAGLGRTRAVIQKDLDGCAAVYERTMRAASIARAPSVIHSELDLVARTLRDLFNDDIDEVWIDSREEYETASRYFDDVMPDARERLHHFDNPIPIFSYFRVEEQIEATYERRVSLPSGGSIVIDETEALVAIDVNSGKTTSEKGHEETVFKTNLEAAEEAARQMKLRDLGGIIVIDFIDMELEKNRRAVEKSLGEASKLDKARFKISRINSKGLCVLTRQRIRQGMRRAFQRRCEVCSGSGWLRTPEAHSLSLLRRLETRLAQGGVGEARVLTHRETAEYLLNRKRNELVALERQYSCAIVVAARAEMDRGKDEVVFLSKGEVLAEITDRLPPREERHSERSRRKKRSRKQRADRAPELEPTGTDAASGEVAVNDEAPRERRKRRKRSRGGDDKVIRLAEEKPKAQQPDAEPNAAAVRHGRFDGTGHATFTGRPPPEVLEKLKAERRARLARRSTGSDPILSAEAMEQTSERPTPSHVAHAHAPRHHRRHETTSEGGDEHVQSQTDEGANAPAVAQAPDRPDRRPRDASEPRREPSLERDNPEEAERARKSLLERLFGSR